jgi:branched-chain amino acid transport system substrate-binding protein
MKRFTRWSLGVFSAMAVAALGAGPAPAAEAIKIGFFAPITGPAAADGASARHAVELAAKEINDAGGIKGRKIELVIYDDRLNPQEAVAVANKLIEKDKVVGVVSGSYSGPTRVTAPIFAKAGIPMVAGYAVHPDVTKAGDSNFRNGLLGVVEGAAAAELAVKAFKAKRIAILSMDNDYGRELGSGFKQRAEKLGATIVSSQSYKFPGEREFRPFLTRVKEANPDLLFACGYYNEGALVTRQAKELGLNVQIVGTEGMDSPKFLELAGPAAEGLVIVTTLNRDDPRPHVQNSLKAYRQAYNLDADMVGASSYDALKILAAAIEKVGTDPKAITKFITESPGFDTLTGPVRRFVKGEPIKPVQVQAVREGKFRYHSVIDNPEVITPPQP